MNDLTAFKNLLEKTELDVDSVVDKINQIYTGDIEKIKDLIEENKVLKERIFKLKEQKLELNADKDSIQARIDILLIKILESFIVGREIQINQMNKSLKDLEASKLNVDTSLTKAKQDLEKAKNANVSINDITIKDIIVKNLQAQLENLSKVNTNADMLKTFETELNSAKNELNILCKSENRIFIIDQITIIIETFLKDHFLAKDRLRRVLNSKITSLLKSKLAAFAGQISLENLEAISKNSPELQDFIQEINGLMNFFASNVNDEKFVFEHLLKLLTLSLLVAILNDDNRFQRVILCTIAINAALKTQQTSYLALNAFIEEASLSENILVKIGYFDKKTVLPFLVTYAPANDEHMILKIKSLHQTDFKLKAENDVTSFGSTLLSTFSDTEIEARGLAYEIFSSKKANNAVVLRAKQMLSIFWISFAVSTVAIFAEIRNKKLLSYQRALKANFFSDQVSKTITDENLHVVDKETAKVLLEEVNLSTEQVVLALKSIGINSDGQSIKSIALSLNVDENSRSFWNKETINTLSQICNSMICGGLKDVVIKYGGGEIIRISTQPSEHCLYIGDNEHYLSHAQTFVKNIKTICQHTKDQQNIDLLDNAGHPCVLQMKMLNILQRSNQNWVISHKSCVQILSCLENLSSKANTTFASIDDDIAQKGLIQAIELEKNGIFKAYKSIIQEPLSIISRLSGVCVLLKSDLNRVKAIYEASKEGAEGVKKTHLSFLGQIKGWLNNSEKHIWHSPLLTWPIRLIQDALVRCTTEKNLLKKITYTFFSICFAVCMIPIVWSTELAYFAAQIIIIIHRIFFANTLFFCLSIATLSLFGPFLLYLSAKVFTQIFSALSCTNLLVLVIKWFIRKIYKNNI